jgi:hypothetical protein
VFCPTDFFLKAIVFTVCEHDYMNIHPPPPLSRLVMALLLGNALYEFSMKRREKCLNLRSPVGISLCVATVNRLLPGCLVTSSRKVFEILHKLNVCVLSNFPTNKRLTVTADLPRRRLIAILVL